MSLETLRAAVGLLNDAAGNPDVMEDVVPKALEMIEAGMAVLKTKNLPEQELMGLLAQLDAALLRVGAEKAQLAEKIGNMRHKTAALSAYKR